MVEKFVQCRNELCAWPFVETNATQCPYCGAYVHDEKCGHLYPFERKKCQDADKRKWLLVGGIAAVVLLLIVGLVISVNSDNARRAQEAAAYATATALAPTPVLSERLGQEVQMGESVSVSAGEAPTLANERLLLVLSPPDGSPSIVLLGDSMLPLSAERRDIKPRITRQGQRLAYLDTDPISALRSVWIWDEGNSLRRLLVPAFDAQKLDAWEVAWNPDGSTLAVSFKEVGRESYMIALFMPDDSTGWPAVPAVDDYAGGLDWVDRERVSYIIGLHGQSKRLVLLNVTNKAGQKVTLPSDLNKAFITSARWSPDMGRLALVTRAQAGGAGQLYLLDTLTDPPTLYPIALPSIRGDSTLAWIDSSHLLYLNQDGQPQSLDLENMTISALKGRDGQHNALDYNR